MYSRTRDIADGDGTCLRVTITPHPGGAMVTLQRCEAPDRSPVVLNLHGAEILGGFIMAARLSAPWPMPDEVLEGGFPVRFRLDCGPPVRVAIEQDGGLPLFIDAALWDRLYAELCLITAHGREMARRSSSSLH